ncbi:MAG: nucleotide sugar dehydrogenase [candidate division Zixibacteria bacterium]|nr:nucleotide sugar dehydrogenase [candidate division Zixibacteria bacterium]
MCHSSFTYLRRHNLYKSLEKKIKNRTAVVGIIGIGYVGLPLAVELGREGFKVIGIDISSAKVKLVNSGKSDIDDVKDKDLKPLVGAGRIKATTDFSVLKKADCVPICVPTPLSKTKDPDVSYILAGVNEVKKYLHPGQLVILESTTYPGTTEELILPMLEETGLKVGKDFFLAFSPERVDPGNEKYTTKNTPRVVGGITPQCTRIAKLFYEQTITQAIGMSSTKSAEMVKLLENTFRSVNIGLVNEVALMCDRLKIDVWEIIDAANTKPFGFMPFYPGPGLGGHCIPIDPHYLSWKLKSLNYYARFIELAGDINSRMPEYVVERINRALNEKKKSLQGSKILVLGVAYKRDIKDVRESPALDVIKLLQNAGAPVKYNDPHVPSIRMDNSVMKSVKLTEKLLQSSDCVAVLTNHSAYDYDFVVQNAQLVMDTRNATKDVEKNREKIVKL